MSGRWEGGRGAIVLIVITDTLGANLVTGRHLHSAVIFLVIQATLSTVTARPSGSGTGCPPRPATTPTPTMVMSRAATFPSLSGMVRLSPVPVSFSMNCTLFFS